MKAANASSCFGIEDSAAPCTLQILEADFLDTAKSTVGENGNIIRQGIEFDKQNRRVAYWMWPQHPGKMIVGKASFQSVRVPADNREVGLLKKEHSEIQAKLDRLVDLLAEGVLPPDDYRNKREHLKKRQHDLGNLIHAYDDADNMFGSTMEKLMKVAMGAHKAFLSSSVEEKRELLNFVFSNLTRKGETLCYSYNLPFNNFENLDDCSKWRRG